MIKDQISIFEYLNIKDTSRIVIFEDLRITISNLPESPHKNMKYKHYTDLIYKVVFDRTAKQLKNDYKIKKGTSLTGILTLHQKMRIKTVELDVCDLLNQGLKYPEIKDIIMNKYDYIKLTLI